MPTGQKHNERGWCRKTEWCPTSKMKKRPWHNNWRLGLWVLEVFDHPAKRVWWLVILEQNKCWRRLVKYLYWFYWLVIVAFVWIFCLGGWKVSPTAVVLQRRIQSFLEHPAMWGSFISKFFLLVGKKAMNQAVLGWYLPEARKATEPQ